MKIFILRVLLFSFGLFMTQSVYAQSCEKLTDTVLAIENQLKTTQLDACTETNKTNCCNRDEDPDSCQSLYDAEIEYNKALADVNMHESLIALSQAIETNHNALRKITPAQLNQAQKKISDFETNLEKADLISSSFDFITKETKGISIWDKYNGETPGDVYAHLENECQNKDYKVFCEKYTNLVNSKVLDQEELLETLNNFAITDRKLNYDPNERKDNYKEYQSYLKVQNPNKDSAKAFLSLSEYKETNEYKDILKLKELVGLYNSKPTSELGKEILAKTKKLEKLNVNFNSGINPRKSFSNNVKTALGKDIRNISSVSGLLMNKDLVKENFKTTRKMMDIDYVKIKNNLEDKLKNSPELFKSCNISFEGETIDQCVTKICETKNINEPCNQTETNKELFAKGFQDVVDKTRQFHTANKLSQFHIALEDCLDKETSSESFKCIKENKEKMKDYISDSLSEAKQNLIKKTNILNHLKGGEPLKKLRFQKYLAVAALEKKDCIEDTQRMTTEPIVSFCSTPNLDGHISSAIELSTGVGKALISYDRKKLLGFYKGLYGENQNFDDYLNKLNESCTSSSEQKKLEYLCEFYQGEKSDQIQKKKQAIAQAQKKKQDQAQELQRVRAEYGLDYEPEPPKMSSGGYAATGLLQGITKGMPSIFGMMAQKRSHDRQMDYYKNMYSYQQSMYASTTTHNTNWINWDFSSTNPTNFNSTGMTYYDSNQLNFNIAPIPFSYTANDGGTYIPTSTSTNSSTGTQFSF